MDFEIVISLVGISVVAVALTFAFICNSLGIVLTLAMSIL